MQPALAPATRHGMRSAQASSGAANQESEQALRDQLLGAVANSGLPAGSAANLDLSQGANSSVAQAAAALSAVSAAGHAHNIDPAIAGPTPATPSQPAPTAGMTSTPMDGPESPDDTMTGIDTSDLSGLGSEPGSERKGAKRELSQTKRAAQNRAAQRAFRQRKEGHIKKLEEQVRDYTSLSDQFKQLQAENYQLRDYIISLQSRLIESQGDFPPAPSNINLQQPSGEAGGDSGAAGSSSQAGASTTGGTAAADSQSAPLATMGKVDAGAGKGP